MDERLAPPMSPAARYYKAVRPDGSSFANPWFQWATEPGGVTAHPNPYKGEPGRNAAHYLSVATTPTDCTGFRWPCRLLVVEPIGRIWHPDTELPTKRAGDAFRTVEELPAHEVFGPQGEQVAALIERLRRLTPKEAFAMAATWDTAAPYDAWATASAVAVRDAAWGTARDAARAAAWGAAWDATWDAATSDDVRGATWDAARDAAWTAAWTAAGAALGVLVRDVLDPEHYRTLTGPAASVLGPLHPDDDSGSGTDEAGEESPCR